MLDETTCPVCGKDLGAKQPLAHDPAGNMYLTYSIWAVAHYLAHLVQQNRPQPAPPHHRLCSCNQCVPTQQNRPQSCKHTSTEAFVVTDDDGGTWYRCVACDAVTGYSPPQGIIINEPIVIRTDGHTGIVKSCVYAPTILTDSAHRPDAYHSTHLDGTKPQ